MDNSILREYIRPLLAWWWLILITAIIAAASAYFYLRDQPLVYRSSTTVMVGESLEDPNPNSAELGLTKQLAQAYAEIAVRAPLRQATMAALGLSSMPEYTVTAREDSSLLEIAVTAAEPELAQAVALELVNQLILLSPTDAIEEGRQEFLDDQLTKLENDILATEEEIEQIESELGTYFSAREINNAEQQIAALRNKENTLRSNYSELLSSAQRNAVNRITVLEPAALPRQPIPSDLGLNIALAALMGIVIGASGAYVIEFFDDSVKNVESAKRQLGLPVLAGIPADRNKNSLVMGTQLRTPVTEAYRELRTNLYLLAQDVESVCLLMSSPTPNDGKSRTTSNLGIALAQAGKTVIIVDADLHRPRQHEHFTLSNRAGLSTALMDSSVDVAGLLQKTGYPGLSVLTSGPLPGRAAELLSSNRMGAVMRDLGARADVVLMDSPPALALVDATVLSMHADAVVLILRAGKTRRSSARKVLEMFGQVDAPVAGCVLNGVSRKHSTYRRMYGYDVGRASASRDLTDVETLAQSSADGDIPPDFVAEPSAQPTKPKRSLTRSLQPRQEGGEAPDS